MRVVDSLNDRQGKGTEMRKKWRRDEREEDRGGGEGRLGSEGKQGTKSLIPRH